MKTGIIHAAALAMLILAAAAGCAAPTARSSAPEGVWLLVGDLQYYLSARGEPPPGEPLLDDDLDLLEADLVQDMVDVPDPLEPWNRLVFRLNDTLYVYAGKPILQGYRAVTPPGLRICIRNFFHNVGTPVRAASCLAQGRGVDTGKEICRFAVNTVAGGLGCRDVAREIGLGSAEEDFGQALAAHGLDNGCYLVWPLLGPSTVRDSVGSAADGFLDPVRYLDPCGVSVGVSVFRSANAGSFRLKEYDGLKVDALDPYVAFRRAYIQYRDKQNEK